MSLAGSSGGAGHHGTATMAKRDIAQAREENPFTMPTDEEIFALRDLERKKKLAEREQQKHLRVYEKQTWSSRTGAMRLRDDDEIAASLAKRSGTGKLGSPGATGTGTGSPAGTAATASPAAAGASPGIGSRSAATAAAAAAAAAVSTGGEFDGRRKEKENLADFIAKKREMFLVQMAIDIKREEIQKLEEQAKTREQILKHSEKLLESDSAKFEQFLKDSDDRAMKAIQKAEKETRIKNEKQQEIKRVTAQNQALESEIAKLKEQLKECKKYKRFLTEVTPEWYKKEWKESVLKLKEQEAERQRQLEAQREAARQGSRLAQPRGSVAAAPPAAGAARARVAALPAAAAAAAAAAATAAGAGGAAAAAAAPASRRGTATAEGSGPAAVVAAALAAGGPGDATAATAATAAADSDDDSEDDFMGETMPMYFTDPQQLLDIFAELEQDNLFLIRNSQDTEETLEEYRTKYNEMQRRMREETESLDAQIKALEAAIEAEEARAKGIELPRTAQGTDAGADPLDTINEHVAAVYARALADNDAKISTLEMLTSIERRLEELFAEISLLDPDEVAAAEHEKEMERREQARQDLLQKKKAEQEDRIQKALIRAREPPFKRVGKPLMFRSQPPQRKKKEVVREVKQTEEDILKQQLFEE